MGWSAEGGSGGGGTSVPTVTKILAKLPRGDFWYLDTIITTWDATLQK